MKQLLDINDFIAAVTVLMALLAAHALLIALPLDLGERSGAFAVVYIVLVVAGAVLCGSFLALALLAVGASFVATASVFTGYSDASVDAGSFLVFWAVASVATLLIEALAFGSLRLARAARG